MKQLGRNHIISPLYEFQRKNLQTNAFRQEKTAACEQINNNALPCVSTHGMFEFGNTTAYYLTPNSRACEIGISLFAKITDSAYNKHQSEKKKMFTRPGILSLRVCGQWKWFGQTGGSLAQLFPLLALIMD
jgi:hypothetical protein